MGKTELLPRKNLVPATMFPEVGKQGMVDEEHNVQNSATASQIYIVSILPRRLIDNELFFNNPRLNFDIKLETKAHLPLRKA